MEIRKVKQDDDFEAIGDVFASSWKIAYKEIIKQSYLDNLSGSHWVATLSSLEYDTYVITENDKYIGVSSVCSARDEKMPDWGEIKSIYLRPEYFGSGYAAQLFESVINVLLEKDLKKIYLWTFEGNKRAQRFYEKQGFKTNGDKMPITVAEKEMIVIKYIKIFE